MSQFNEKRSYTEYTTTVPTQDFTIGFQFYEDEQHLTVLLDSVDITELGYTFKLINSSTVRITPSITGVVRIQRETNIDVNKFQYTAGALFEARTMDANFEQVLHSQQEVRDSFYKLDRTVIESINQNTDLVNKAVAASNVAVTTANVALVTANKANTTANNASKNSNDALARSTDALARSTEALNVAGQASAKSDAAVVTSNTASDKVQTALDRADLALSVRTSGVTIYTSTEEGLNNTKSGELFSVISSDVGAVSDLYMNVAGVAVSKDKSTPSTYATWGASQVKDSSGVTQQEVNDRLLGAGTIDLAYLKPVKGFNISPILQSALNVASIRPVKILLPHGDFTMESPVTTPTDSKGVVLDLNGSTLKPTVGYVSRDGYAIALTSTTLFPCIIRNGRLDGSLRKQNLFEYTNIQDYFRDATGGLYLSGDHVQMDNFHLSNLYGQATKFMCVTFNVSDSTVINCGGHWYTNDGYDMFGDLFYIGTGNAKKGLISGKFSNVIGLGKSSDQYPENHQVGSPLTQVQYSRAGLVLENFGGTKNDVRITFKDCDIRGVERGVHQEIEGITSYINLINTRLDSCVTFGAYLTDTLNAFSDESCFFGLYDSEYNGSKGLSRGYRGLSYLTMRGGTVLNLGTTANTQMLATGGNVTATGTKFLGVSNLLATSAKLHFKDCYIQVIKHSTLSYWAWSTEISFDNTTVEYIGTEGIKSLADSVIVTKMHDSTFKGIILNIDTAKHKDFKDNTLVVPNDFSTNFKGSLYKVVHEDGSIYNTPNLLWGIPPHVQSENLLSIHTVVRPIDSAPTTLLTADLVTYAKRCRLFLMVVKCHDDTNFAYERLSTISQVDYGCGYYVALCKYDATAPNKVVIVKPFTSVGSTVGSGYNVTIDATFGVSSYGSYVRGIYVACIPYPEIHTLPYIPDNLLHPIPVSKVTGVGFSTGTDDTSLKLNQLLANLKSSGVMS